MKWDGNHGSTNARLNKPSGGGKTGAWSSKTNDANQWIQVKFFEVTKVTQVGIQGRYDANQWVTKFKVSYSLDGVQFSIQSKASLIKLQLERRMLLMLLRQITTHEPFLGHLKITTPGFSFSVIKEIFVSTGIRREQQS